MFPRSRRSSIGFLKSGLLDGVELLSVDVFDTAVVRTTVSPHDVFTLVAHELSDFLTVTPSEFGRQRVAAEHDCRLELDEDRNEVTLAEIMQRLAERLELPPALVPRLVAAELDLEARVSRVNPEVQAFVAEAERRGIRVMFLSDMYLPAATVVGLLHQAGYRADEVIVSSELQMTKAMGSMFDHLLASTGIPASAILHIGDDAWSDGSQPLTRSMRSQFVASNRQLTSSRLTWDTESGGPPIERNRADIQLLGLAAGRLRREPTTVDIGYYTTGPLAVALGLWVDDLAATHHPDHVLFCAREGKIVREAALAFGRTLDADQALYLEVSRRSLLLPSVAGDVAGSVERLSEGATEIPLIAYATRLGFDEREIRRSVAAPLSGKLDEPVDIWNKEPARLLLVELADLIEERAATELEALGRYLEHLGVKAGQRVVFFDVGWHGSLQQHFHAATDRLGLELDVRGAYLGLFASPPGSFDCFAFSPTDNETVAEAVRQRVEVIEMVLQADHPTVDHLGSEGPVLALLDENLWITSDLQQGGREFLADARALGLRDRPSTACFGPALRLLSDPSPAEARRLGSFRHAEGFGADAPSVPLAFVPSIANLRDLKSLRSPDPHATWWTARQAIVSTSPLLARLQRARRRP